MVLARNVYQGGECPDCGTPIPPKAQHGDACKHCGHVFIWGDDDDLSDASWNEANGQGD